MYKLFLTFRYLRKRRIAYFAVAAVTLCTAMVLIVMSVMGGFLDMLKVKARGLLGDIIMDNRSFSGFPLYDEFIADISTWPEIAKATPVLYSFGLLRFEGTTQTDTVRVVGIRLEDSYEITAFKQGLFYERHYPGTTTLAEQQQPLWGLDPNQTITLTDDTGPRQVPRPVLPPVYQQALEKSWAAGVRDTESPPDPFADEIAQQGVAPLIGIYDPVASAGPPEMGGDPQPGLIIGRDIIARRLADGTYRRSDRWPRGAIMTLTLVPATSSGTLDTPVKRAFRYVDDSRTGIYEIDSQHVYCDFELLQRLLLMNETERVDPETGATVGKIRARCSQIQIKIRPVVDGVPVNAEQLAQRLEDHYHSMASREQYDLYPDEVRMIRFVEGLTWEESQAHVIAPVENERQLVTILFGIISLVAGVLVLCILYMIVLQKTRDIGIIKSIGASSAGVAAIFISYGAAIGVVGSVLGGALGYAFVVNINSVQDFLVSAFGWRVWDRSVYSFDEIPNTVRTSELVGVMITAILTATIGSLLAAWRAGAMNPVEALRHE